MNLKRKILALLAAATIAMALPAAVLGHVQGFGGGSACVTGAIYADVHVYGNGNFSPSTDPGRFCYGTNDHGNFSSAPAETFSCEGWLGISHSNFDNCITSITVTVHGGAVLCLYNNTNQDASGGGIVVVGNWSSSQLSSSYDDNLSSWKWTTNSSNC